LFNKKASKDRILRIIKQPLKIEFLVSGAILKKLKNVKVKLNFISDYEELFTSFAADGNPDIEYFENDDMVW
jgi:hypothetical protein